MIDWLAISCALVIIAVLVAIFGFMAWKINMPDPLISTNVTGKKDDTNQLFDSVNDKKKKDKHNNEQAKKKRKDSKKLKRDNKEEDQQQHTVKFKEPASQTSEETDNEREESEQESSPAAPPQVIETSSKARKRNKKTRSTTPPSSSDHIEGILTNKYEKSPVTTHPQPIPHPKLATMIPKDEVELAKQQQSKIQVKSSQPSNKQTIATASSASVKKSIPTITNVNQEIQKQQEQPFTTVVGKRDKAATPPSQQQQQQQQQQQNKSVNTTPSPTTAAPAPIVQQQAPVQVQHEQLAQRQPPRQQKETPTPHNGFNTNPSPPPVKQSTIVTTAPPPPKFADLVKTLPTSQAVVTELMSALDAFPLSTDELDIIMHKIANKQSVIKQDWTKLQHGKKVDPQAHIGQVLDESARAYEEDMKNNAIKRIQELTDECNNDKRRINDLIKETNDKDLNIQMLHAQLNTFQTPQQQFQSFQVELKRLTEENTQLKQRLTQQQQYSTLNITPNNSEPSNAQLYVLLNEQVKKLSVENGNHEKQLKTKDLLIKEGQKEKDELLRTNQQLIQKAQETQKQFHHNEEKLRKELNDNRTLHINQLNEYKQRIEQLQLDNEKLKHEEIIHVEPTNTILNNDERDQFQQEINQLKQQLTEDNEQYKKKFDEIQIQYQSQENSLRQEIEQLKTLSQQHDQTQNTQIDALRAELEEAKAKNDLVNLQSNERIQQEQNKQKQFLIEFLEPNVRNQLPNDSQDFNQWLSSYEQIFKSSIESSKQILQDELQAFKNENDQLHQNMSDIANHLKEIEQTVQSKEEILLADLKNKDATLENIRDENEQLNSEIQRLRTDLDHLRLTYNEAINETCALKLQLNERLLINNNNSPSNTTDESFEFVKQSSSPSSSEIDTRAKELTELIRTGKEALENQDSIAQQLDKHLNEIHPVGIGEMSTSNVDESTVSSSSSSEQQPS